MSKNITLKELEKTKKDYLKEEKNTIVRHALSSSSMDKVVTSLDYDSDTNYTFSIDLKTLPVSDQKRSGRCWIFSASTVVREIINKKCHFKDQFEISQNYISYFDKLEKYNFYMEHVIDLVLKGEKHDDRKMNFLLSFAVGDGGQWDMYVDLIKKYGIVPKAAFAETEQSNNTAFSTKLCNSILRKFASEVYDLYNKKKGYKEMEELKDVYMKKVYTILTDSFGVPPTKFDFEYVDKDNNYHIEKNMTPKSFFDKYVGKEIDDYVSIINAPTSDKEYYKTYNVELVGNVIDGKPITHLNLPLERIEELIINQLKDNTVVWFGSDVSYYGKRETGKAIWDDKAFDYETAFAADFKFDKARMLDFYNSAMNHAMVITGVDLKDNKPIRWKIENSWGSDLGQSGYFIQSESWFKYFVYQAAIKKQYLNEKELKALEEKPVLLPPWDPFGTLAD